MDYTKTNSFDGYIKNRNIITNYQDVNRLIKSMNKNNSLGSINPPKGIFEPDPMYNHHSVDPRGLRQKYYKLTYRILRDIASKVAPVIAVHTLRTMQIRPFSFRSYNSDETGFCVKLKDKKATPDKQEKKEIEEIEEFFLNTGFKDFQGAGEREDTIQEINEAITRELYTIDQIGISLRRNRKGKLLDFWLLDGATIVRTMKNVGFDGDKKIKFVQEIEGHIVETFTDNDIIFYYSNRLTDIYRKGYGFSYLEQCVDVITSWVFGMSYNKEFFNTSAQPKGILSFEDEDADQLDIEELQRQWISMFQGIKGMWKTPFLTHKAKWQNISPSNRDMEYNEYLQVLSSWIFAIHGTDAQEIGLRLNQAQNVLNENQESKIAFSKSRALRDLLFSLSTIYNKILQRVPEWDKYQLVFTGLEAKDQAAEEDVKTKAVKTRKTVNEIRAEEDDPPLEYGDIILDPQYIQYAQSQQQMKQQSEQGINDQTQTQENNNTDSQEPDFEINEDDLEEIKKSKNDDFIEIIL